jgi:hypothetical protein
MGCAESEGSPITVCRSGGGAGQFAFIELRTPAETANCLHLNGIQVGPHEFFYFLLYYLSIVFLLPTTTLQVLGLRYY